MAKNTNANYTLTGHVNLNSRPGGYASQFISTTKDFDNVAKVYSDETGYTVVRIDLDKLLNNVEIFDLTTEDNRESLLNGWQAKTWANSSVEVHIKGFIPPEEIEVFYQH